jgi:hypothetical protein
MGVCDCALRPDDSITNPALLVAWLGRDSRHRTVDVLIPIVTASFLSLFLFTIFSNMFYDGQIRLASVNHSPFIIPLKGPGPE